jgi:hypothetical protein
LRQNLTDYIAAEHITAINKLGDHGLPDWQCTREERFALQFPQNRVADHKHWNPVMDKRSDMLELTRRTFCYGQTLDELTKNGFRMEAAPA